MEFKRIFINKKVIGLIFLLFILVICFYLYNNRQINKEEYTLKQNEHVEEYGKYIDNILEQRDTLLGISIFQDVDSYSYKNIIKTGNDYSKMADVTLCEGDYQSVESVLEFGLVEVFFAFFAVIVVWNFFEDEKKGLKTIIYSTYEGRYKLAFRRIGILSISTVMFVLFVYILLFGVSILVYGKPDTLSAPVQSMMCRKTFTGEVNIWIYFLIFMAEHILKTICFGMFVWMIMCFHKNKIISIGILLIVLIIEGVLCFKIPSQSTFVFFKYINIFRLIYSTGILDSYLNISIFGAPVGVINAYYIFVLVFMLVSSAICILISHFKRTISVNNKIEIRIAGIIDAITRSIHRFLARMNIFQMEIYKILINQKGIFIFAIWIILLFSQVDTNNVFLMGNKTAMSEIYEEYSGVDDGRLREYYKVNYDELNNYQILKIKEQLSYMDKVKIEQDIDVWFIDQKPYNVLWSENGLYLETEYEKQEMYGVLTVSLIILLLSNLFMYDNNCGLKKVIHSTVKGREKIFNLKVCVVLLTVFVVCLIVYGTELYEINSIYPMTSLNAPIQSVSCMEKFPYEISILGYLIFVELIHLLCSIAIAFISIAIKECIGNIKGLFMAVAILIAPGILKILGFEWGKNISVIQPMIFVESYADYGFWYAFVQVIVLIIASILSLVYLRIKWCRSR